MSELELNITVKGSINIGEQIRATVEEGEIVLASDSYTFDVIKLERADGLPLAIEEDFSDWYSKSNLGQSSRDVAYKAYVAGRAAK